MGQFKLRSDKVVSRWPYQTEIDGKKVWKIDRIVKSRGKVLGNAVAGNPLQYYSAKYGIKLTPQQFQALSLMSRKTRRAVCLALKKANAA